MRVCVVSGAPEALEGVLSQAGHEVKTCLSTDMAVAVAEKHSAEVVVFCEDVPEVGGVTREDALKLLTRRFRVVLVISRDNPLVMPAAGLGVDFVFVPASPAEVLYRVEHTAEPEERAAILRGMSVHVPGISPEALAEIAARAEVEKEQIWSKLFRPGGGKAARPPVPEEAGRLQQEAEAEEKEAERHDKGSRLSVPKVNLPRVNFRALKPASKVVRKRDTPGLASSAVRAGGQHLAGKTPEGLAAVWSPSGFVVSFTALNLAVAAGRMGYDVALLNFNLANPETDFWFGVRQTEPAKCRLEDAGIMTFGTSMTPELAVKMLEKRGKTWGVWYLPAGNKLGNIGTPDFSSEHVELFQEIIHAAHGREVKGAKFTVVEAGAWFEQPPVMAALAACPVVVVPLMGEPQEKTVLDMYLEELARLGVKPRVVEFYPLDADGALRRAGKAPPALEGDARVWCGLVANVVEKSRRRD
ncbi:hypothetical protein V3F56_03300 [Moorellaceae bacterium AZ2]